MSTPSAVVVAPDDRPSASNDPSGRVLVAGILGRTWLWFVAACLVITLVPMLFGWHAFTIKSGSMEPRIHVGDVLLAAPVSDRSELIGRVAIFTDPDHRDRTKAHRILAANPDGSLQSKGDANPTADSAPVRMDEVQGLARLVVRYAGLPLVWAQTGQWGWVSLFLLSLVLSAWAVSRDQEDDQIDPQDPPAGELVPLPGRGTGRPSRAQAAATPLSPELSRTSHPRPRAATSPLRRWSWRLSLAGLLGMALALPPASAAFSATTTSPASTWAVANWNYTTQVTGLSPWMYWKLDDTTGTIAADSSGNGRTGTYSPDASTASFTRGVVGALSSETPNRAVTLASGSCLTSTSTTPVPGPSALTEMVWFKTSTTVGGKLLGFESPQSGVTAVAAGGAYDRHLYLDAAGQVWFGIGTTTFVGIRSQAGLNDGSWHMAAATLGPSGMALYIDGAQVATNPATAAGSYNGWWRAGCGNLSGWVSYWDGGGSPSGSTNQPRNFPFAGSLDEISVWQSVLTAAQIQFLYMSR